LIVVRGIIPLLGHHIEDEALFEPVQVFDPQADL